MKKFFSLLILTVVAASAQAKINHMLVKGTVVSFDEKTVVIQQNEKKAKVPRTALSDYKTLKLGQMVAFDLLIPESVKIRK